MRSSAAEAGALLVPVVHEVSFKQTLARLLNHMCYCSKSGRKPEGAKTAKMLESGSSSGPFKP